MAKAKTEISSRKMRPALDPEARTNQLIALATDLVEQRLRDGTASSQETTHFLKQATAKYQLELELAKEQKELMSAKKDQLRSEEKMEKLMVEAISAIRDYQGRGEPDDY